MKSLFLSATLASMATYVSGNATGSGTCDASAMPGGMAGRTRNAASTFTLTADSGSYAEGGGALTFTVEGGDFVGILIYAEDGSGNRVGDFSAKTGLGAKTCTEGETFTHSSSATKNSPYTIEWTPPAAGA